MKKIYPIPLLALLAFTGLIAQSGGTNFNVRLERLSEKVDELADRIELRAEITADNWETRAERLGDQAERLGEQMEDKWDNNWSIRIGELGKSIGQNICPEVAFLGIETHELSFEKAKKLGFENRYGSYVSKVMAKSSAEKAGLQAFDYIYGINDQRTSNNQNLSDILEDYEVGDEINLQFVRKGEKMTTKIKLAKYEYEPFEDESAHPFLGISPTDDEDEDELNGVSVDIVEKSTAEEMGLKVGDVITSINGFPILDWDDVTTAVQNTKPGESIEVQFMRDEKALSAKGTIKSYDELYPEEEHGNWNLDIDWDEIANVSIMQGDDWEQQEDQDENRAFIGIYTDMISKEKADKLGFDNPFGAYITGVIPNSGAERAGLKPFDYIYGFDEYRAGAEQHLGLILKKYKPGQTATVHYIRRSKSAKASITFTQPFTVEKADMNSCEDPFFGIIQLDLNDEGVVIQPVSNSTAAELDLKEGDVVTQINGYPMVDWQDVATAIDLMKPGETIYVDYQRNGRAMKASKPIKSYAQTKNCADCNCGGKPTVVIATTPKINTGRGWVNEITTTSTAPRVNLNNVKTTISSISGDETNSLRSKGVQLSESNSLSVENIQLTPNTQTGMFNLDFNLPSSGNTLVRIYNLTGRVLYEYDLGNFSGKFSDSVDISQNGVGNYFLEISQSGKVFTKKITLTKG
ncbi:MAG: PDZ domain-containing protein [Bacteroidetes bacterium]|nr:PDZ domain-containing protein [Bacteroidota bacterium]